ncbi:MAG: hypothetical protein ACRCYO_17350, partial [Bacteroidia bacterium]
MRIASFLLFFLCTTFFVNAQLIELPDSAKIRANRIQSITVYKEISASFKSTYQTYEYDKRGR